MSNWEEQWEEDYVATQRDSMPLVRDPSGGSARMSLRTSGVDCATLMHSSIARGYPYTDDGTAGWRGR